MMLCRLLAGVLLPTLSTAMLLPTGTSGVPGGPEYPGNYSMPLHPGPNYTMPDQENANMMRAFSPGDSSDMCDLLLPPGAAAGSLVPWACYCRYCKGAQGDKGDHGQRGLQGPPGSAGRRGLVGFTGRRGFTGPPGLKGQKGDDGEKGDVGPAGIFGSKGARGFKGDKGDIGSLGLPGVQGPIGEDGTCPQPCVSKVGQPGPPGLPGSPGARGLPGLEGPRGPQGLSGLKGDIGPLGVPGRPGMKGDMGEEGLCNCTDGQNGTTGAPGLPGLKGDTGSMGTEGEPGTKGDEGLPGPLGPPGFQGPPGPCSPGIKSAFSAALRTSFPEPSLPVSFQNVLYNVQNNFIPDFGMYMAPVNGTYFFTYALTVKDRPLIIRMFHEFTPVARSTVMNSYVEATQQVVLHMSEGQRVWLQVKDNENNGIYVDSDSSSTFSGFLLYPDDCMAPLLRGFHHTTQEPITSFPWDGKPTQPPWSPTAHTTTMVTP